MTRPDRDSCGYCSAYGLEPEDRGTPIGMIRLHRWAATTYCGPVPVCRGCADSGATSDVDEDCPSCREGADLVIDSRLPDISTGTDLTRAAINRTELSARRFAVEV